MIALFGAALLAAGAPDPQIATETVTLEIAGRALRVRDIAVAQRDADVVLLEIPAGQGAIMLDEATRRTLLRNRFPASPPQLKHGGDVLVTSRLSATDNRPCLVSLVEIFAGEFPVRDDLEEIECGEERSVGLFAYDAGARAPRARVDIPAGTIFARIPIPAQRPVAAGHDTVVRFASGPVIVEREVTTVQSSRPGTAIFVKDEDGQVFAVATLPERKGE